MSSKTVIHTVRHAQTTFGEEKRYAGTIDVPLSESGRKDALAAADKLPEKAFDVVITSEKKRSIQTARCLLGEDAVFTRIALCNERNYGQMEGRTWDEVKKMDPPILLSPWGKTPIR